MMFFKNLLILMLLLHFKAKGNAVQDNGRYVSITHVVRNGDRVFEYFIFEDSLQINDFDFSKARSPQFVYKIVMDKERFKEVWENVSNLKCCLTERYKNTLYIRIYREKYGEDVDFIKLNADSFEGKKIMEFLQ